MKEIRLCDDSSFEESDLTGKEDVSSLLSIGDDSSLIEKLKLKEHEVAKKREETSVKKRTSLFLWFIFFPF